jgi:tRNA(fMet)-specific endonuclease VapC
MMYLLDTDTLTHAHLGNRKVQERIEQAGEDNVATTIVSAIEVLRGRHEFLLKAANGDELLRAQELLDASEALLLDTQIICVNARVAAEFDKVRLDKKLKKIGRPDLLIACIARAHQATLVTRNVVHFRQMHGLKVENWVD